VVIKPITLAPEVREVAALGKTQTQAPLELQTKVALVVTHRMVAVEAEEQGLLVAMLLAPQPVTGGLE
jgi:hypothetical protein